MIRQDKTRVEKVGERHNNPDPNLYPNTSHDVGLLSCISHVSFSMENCGPDTAARIPGLGLGWRLGLGLGLGLLGLGLRLGLRLKTRQERKAKADVTSWRGRREALMRWQEKTRQDKSSQKASQDKKRLEKERKDKQDKTRARREAQDNMTWWQKKHRRAGKV